MVNTDLKDKPFEVRDTAELNVSGVPLDEECQAAVKLLNSRFKKFGLEVCVIPSRTFTEG